jgi:Putative 2OG-Fe(II) oxygenase
MCSANQNESIEEVLKEQVQSFMYFPSAVYTIEKKDFLEVSKKVCGEKFKKIKKERKLDEIYPVYMTDNLFGDERMQPVIQYILDTGWNILQSQGYNMANLQTTFTEMWCQEHYKHSAMEQHTHGGAVQLVGFYFLDVPDNSSKVVFHDPKAGKVQINLPETDMAQATFASNMINFTPKEGLLMFTNSWLAHSFTRHASTKPMRFIHFNIAVQQAPQVCAVSDAEVI